MTDPEHRVLDAVEREDVLDLARAASKEELERLSLAEDVVHKRHERGRRRSRILTASQALVGYVALVGFFANAYQNWASERRWKQEFERSRQNDQQRSFFETTALAADERRDKRLVGYTLLKRFMTDPGYHDKAMLFLREALTAEFNHLARPEAGAPVATLENEHDSALVAILSALALTDRCGELAAATNTISRVALSRAPTELRRETLHLYVRWLFGRALEICTSWRDVRSVRAALAEALVKKPELAGEKSKVSDDDANGHLAGILSRHCADEIGRQEVADCETVLARYRARCDELAADKTELAREQTACRVIRAREAPEDVHLQSLSPPRAE